MHNPTLPEGMVAAIKDLSRAYDAYCRQIEEMIVVREALRTQIERLVPKAQHPKSNLDNMPLDPNVRVELPNGILPPTHKLVPKEENK